LKPRAKLVVVTPNGAALGHSLLASQWYPLETPRHLHVFTPRSLRACAERSGVRVDLLQTSARNAGAMWVASKANGSDTAGSHLRRPAAVLLRLQSLALQLIEEAMCACGRAVGEEIVLVAVKE
jgi:hypothetical protein